MDDQNKNLILATALSFLVILVWFVLFPPPEPNRAELDLPPETATTVDGVAQNPSVAPTPGAAQDVASTETPDPVEAAPRLDIDTPRVVGTISLQGGRIDDLSLKDYRVSIEPDADIVTMLSPVGTENAYYALYGWAPGSGLGLEDVPGPNTLWAVESGETLTPTSPVNLIWDNGKGLIFRRTIEIDGDYMFTITQSVANSSGTAAVMD